MCGQSMKSYMHTVMHAQHANMHAQHANMHAQYIIMKIQPVLHQDGFEVCQHT